MSIVASPFQIFLINRKEYGNNDRKQIVCECDWSLTHKICSWCRKGAFDKCSACSAPRYCSKECQNYDWSQTAYYPHKKLCRILQNKSSPFYKFNSKIREEIKKKSFSLSIFDIDNIKTIIINNPDNKKYTVAVSTTDPNFHSKATTSCTSYIAESLNFNSQVFLSRGIVIMTDASKSILDPRSNLLNLVNGCYDDLNTFNEDNISILKLSQITQYNNYKPFYFEGSQELTNLDIDFYFRNITVEN